MLKTDLDRAVCRKYSQRDAHGLVHCNDCPLNRTYNEPYGEIKCKATHHWDAEKKRWMPDE